MYTSVEPATDHTTRGEQFSLRASSSWPRVVGHCGEQNKPPLFKSRRGNPITLSTKVNVFYVYQIIGCCFPNSIKVCEGSELRSDFTRMHVRHQFGTRKSANRCVADFACSLNASSSSLYLTNKYSAVFRWFWTMQQLINRRT